MAPLATAAGSATVEPGKYVKNSKENTKITLNQGH